MRNAFENVDNNVIGEEVVVGEAIVTEVGAVANSDVISEEDVNETITIEVEAVANTEVMAEESVAETLTANTAPIIAAVTQPKKKIAPPPKFDYEPYRFRPTDYIEKLPVEIEAEELLAQHPDKADVINDQLNEELKDYFGVEWQKNREVIVPARFAEALTTVLPATIYTNLLFLYNKAHGTYEPISRNRFQEIAMYIVDEKLSSDLYETSKENSYTNAFYRKVGYKKQYDYYEPNSQYIAFPNGTLDLFTMEFTGHSKDYNVSNYLSYNYEPDAKCPEFEKTLNIIFQSDQALIDSLQELFGSFLLHGTNDAIDKVAVFYGRGSNGKSLTAQTLEHVLQPHHCSAKPLADLSGKFGLASIHNMWLNISTEERKSILDTSILKSLTSGDSITVEKKHKDAFKAVPHVKLLTCCNDLPEFNDSSDGMLRRILVYPFQVRFVENPNPFNKLEYKRDAFLKDRLLAERAGILNWMLVGLSRFLDNGKIISMAPASKKYLKDIKAEADPVRVFIESCITKSLGVRTKTRTMHECYLEWLKVNNIKNTKYNSNQAFHRKFKEQLLENQLPCRVTQVNGYDYYNDLSIDTTYPLNPAINF